MKVWMVEQGDYSDYRVVGIFSTRTNAKRIADAINAGDGYNKAIVVSRELNPCIDELNAGLRMFGVCMSADGHMERCEPVALSSYGINDSLSVWLRSKAPAYKGTGIKDAVHGHVWAKDEAHAAKITNEQRVQLIASGRLRQEGQ
jgi:hypothetical protein